MTKKKQKERIKRKRTNWFSVFLMLFFFLTGLAIGTLSGIISGIDYTFTKTAESIAFITQGSTINVSVNLNETAMMDRAFQHLEPYLNKTFSQINNNSAIQR